MKREISPLIRIIHKKVLRFYIFSIIFCLFISTFLISPEKALAINEDLGKDLFIKHCSGCHINGGNIIRRNKTLKVKDLRRNGIYDEESIAKIAAQGIGTMNGYDEVLGQEGAMIVANWIFKEAQNAWIQG